MEDKLFFTIKEASSILKIEPYVLRYWESCFKEIKPERTKSGHRRYRKEDIDLLKKIKSLLYEQRFTIEGVKKYLRTKEKETPNFITEVKQELKELLNILK
ncbi:MAG: MerR family transcriptional regulator [bacterium]